MPTVSRPVQSTFRLLPNDTALEVACIIAGAGPIGSPGIRGRMSGVRPLTDRGVRFCLGRLHRLQLVTRHSGPNGLYLYTALPKLRRLLEAAEITLETFQTTTESPPPSDSTWQADDPASLGL